MKFLFSISLVLIFSSALFAQIPNINTPKKKNPPKIKIKKNYQTPGVYVQEIPSGARAIAQVETAVPVFIGHTETGAGATQRIRSMLDYESNFGRSRDDFFMYESVRLFFENGGRECHIVSAGSFDTRLTRRTLGAALTASKRLDAQLVVIPDAVRLPERQFYGIQNAMLNVCARLGDRFAILNTFLPTGETIQFIEDFRAGMGNSNLKSGAVYYPWLENADGKIIPPAGAIAGIYAQVDQNRGVWKAPANVSLSGVRDVSVAVDDNDQNSMNVDPRTGKSINAIRKFTGKGILVWGSRTLAGNDNEWRYVPVRRFVIMLESSIEKSLDWVVFEPNDEPLWNATKGAIENFMTQQWRSGALQGIRAEEAFFVKCGLGKTMTETDINQGRMIVEIGFAPVRPAEFIVLKMEFKTR